MPTGKGRNKHETHKKPLNKAYSTASWEERLTEREKEDDGNITDPELLAEKEYALEHGSEFDMNLGVESGGLAVAAAAVPEPKFSDKSKKDAINAKVKLAKADRKARSRGVSGSMCKKDKGISCGGFHTLMDMDVYYGLDDAYDSCFMSDTEEPFDGHEDGYDGAGGTGKPGKAEKSNADLMNDDMRKMSFDGTDEADRPGPSRPHPGASGPHPGPSGVGKPNRLYRL